jgi:hypothetical protein
VAEDEGQEVVAKAPELKGKGSCGASEGHGPDDGSKGPGEGFPGGGLGT